MTCHKSRKYISRSIDGDLSERESARLEHHLGACGECRALQADLRKIVDGAARLETPEPSERVWLDIRAGLTREKAAGATGRSADLRRPAFGLGLLLFRSSDRESMGVGYRPHDVHLIEWGYGINRHPAEEDPLYRR